MSLAQFKPIGFLPTTKPDDAREFYEDTLGLEFLSDDGFALVFNAGGNMLRIARMREYTPTPFTVYGWEVPDVATQVAALAAKGIEFLHFSYREQDESGIWSAPGGDKVAWFKDPDGNVLSLSQHANR
jgi:catechol 2,3-dioxygenase-like lactoylglutathione lyase family enzyme